MADSLIDRLPPWGQECYRTLLAGDLQEGFRQFEARIRRRMPGQQWTGQPLCGQTVLVHGAEGGHGDDLMFARYAPMIAQRGGRVVLLIPRNLARLFATMPGIADIIPTDLADGSKKQARTPSVALHYHYYVSTMSLPYAFGTTLDTIPADPYLRGDPAGWAPFLAKLPGLKVGLCWAGEYRPGKPLDSDADALRSMRLADMAPLLDVPGCSFVSLQLGPPAAQMRLLKDGSVHDVSRRLKDWRDTADLVAGLDLVISVDTAVCHLAGSLGKPVWMLNRHDTEWRWLRDRTDTPWYPSMRIYRQDQPRDWRSVIDRVRADLQSLAARQT